ncbi:hypothetical protein [Vibrio parahaemolyticus]|uniref:DUF4145 domain-containing protein n=1 Tax=Vibrio parahaemolyticus TaxID=670 RepID=A0AA47JE09_VIBPH|nr:hypothetical protein [Vibrio parahaemolyticus]MCX8778926.1 hypothetical protein [Vibrio parahaemolyticus]MEA5349455.1 hypothetical protein [Vibrio parahaemolyticus]ODY80280.1 hypothetical protein BBM29_06945 [Vibrio parahaemolyticus]WAT89027.1 hypothetical protein O1Q84_10185 [Vibrio parahaemolyticus]HCE2185966.1 hypothetical protein [Vibrio parahaemolyticus]
MKSISSQRVISRVESLIKDGYTLLETIEPRFDNEKDKKKGRSRGEYVDELLHLKFVTSSLHFIETIFGKDSIFYIRFDSRFDGIAEEPVKLKIALLEAMKVELEEVWYWTAQGLANAEVFNCMLEESEHLLEKGFKIPAAVLAGCVLESHIRKLCEKNDIDLYATKSNGDISNKKASRLAQELTQNDIFNKNDSKEVTNYLGIRNSAAHGHSEQFDDEQVKIMQLGIAGIISRNPI